MDNTDCSKSKKMKFRPSRIKCLLCYLVAIWIAGILLSYLFMGKKSNMLEIPDTISYMDDHRSKKINLSDIRLERFHSYCNPIQENVHGDDGYSSRRMKLGFVAIMIRHGDRGPLNIPHNMTNLKCQLPLQFQELLSGYVSNISNARLPKEFVGSRYPVGDDCEKEQLSKFGVVQLIKLGSFLKEKYSAKLDLHTESLSPDTFKIFVTPKSRTFESALAFTYGFAPNLLRSPEPLRISKADIRFCFENSLCNCPLVNALDATIYSNTQNLVHSHPAIENLLSFLSKVLIGEDSKSITPLVALDLLSLSVCHQKSYPCSYFDNSCLSPEHLQRLMSYIEWSTAKLADNTDYYITSRLKSQGFFIHLLENILASIVPTKRKTDNIPNIVLYSGHDTNVEAVLMAMGHKTTTLPPYASRIIFEVYSETIGIQQKKYFIRILFNGKDITRYTSFCRELWPKTRLIKEIVNKVSCPLDSFIDFVNNSHLKMMKAKNFEEACRLPSQPNKL